MSSILLLNAAEPEERRVALVREGRLEEFRAEPGGAASPRGNVYQGRVVNLESGIGAAFVSLGTGRNGFLHQSDCVGAEGGEPGRIEDHLSVGDEVLVQVTRESVGDKGPMLTQNVGLPGRFLVLLPFSPGAGVSRRIADTAQRDRLRVLLEGLDAPAEHGWILRTAAAGATRREIRRDFGALRRLWRAVQKRAREVEAPALVHAEGDLLVRALRDLVDRDVDEIQVDQEEAFRRVEQGLRAVQPRLLDRLRLYRGRSPLFHAYEVEEQVDRLRSRRVPLPGGGSLVIDRTEALVAIDVNSGRTREEEGLAETARRTNLEAAEEAARQLRLRDLGGLVVVDFIDMTNKGHVREVERTLRAALRGDRAKVRMSRMGSFGTVGNPGAVGLRVYRELRARCARPGTRGIRLALHPDAAGVLREERAGALEELSRASGRTIRIVEDETVPADGWRLEHLRSA
jgi:ribonuclease E